ncbi:hypothetical protein [Legionella maioricensis]|uniref:Uncharacterized protein n=1 Tax=Legionella maioricensis TaxID=2896528 RepID=A0A9X2D0M3_9GAMM|nr:hypothetical protein [Legionella maioricensis]MCL9684415.1 hypothetical protein [Legionella maioricensis]MCL9687596.1 hypothetical protein [Legionella maioricensis]
MKKSDNPKKNKRKLKKENLEKISGGRFTRPSPSPRFNSDDVGLAEPAVKRISGNPDNNHVSH